MGKRLIKTVAVVTGSRAEFGLLRPVIDAVKRHRGLRLRLVVAGSHFLPPAKTVREVEAAYRVDGRVPMQRAGAARTRAEDARSVARGIDGFARAFAKLEPDWVVVLGDRIEAFAAASAASIAGIGVCHIHGGDRAEGIADEAMRHAITKLAHLHCAATKKSAQRIVRMGERPDSVHVTGSPAVDGLDTIKPMGDAEAKRLGDPSVVMLLHPSGFGPGAFPYHPEKPPERWFAELFVFVLHAATEGFRPLLLLPNADPGREHIAEVFESYHRVHRWAMAAHLPRAKFIALLKRLARRGGMLAGNSSAGLIECAALGVPVLNVGPRQSGRERGGNVIDLRDFESDPRSQRAINAALALGGRLRSSDLYGDGRAGSRIAALLAITDPGPLIRKRNRY